MYVQFPSSPPGCARGVQLPRAVGTVQAGGRDAWPVLQYGRTCTCQHSVAHEAQVRLDHLAPGACGGEEAQAGAIERIGHRLRQRRQVVLAEEAAELCAQRRALRHRLLVRRLSTQLRSLARCQPAEPAGHQAPREQDVREEQDVRDRQRTREQRRARQWRHFAFAPQKPSDELETTVRNTDRPVNNTRAPFALVGVSVVCAVRSVL